MFFSNDFLGYITIAFEKLTISVLFCFFTNEALRHGFLGTNSKMNADLVCVGFLPTGMPFNQLGTLAGSKFYNVEATYYYLRW